MMGKFKELITALSTVGGPRPPASSYDFEEPDASDFVYELKVRLNYLWERALYYEDWPRTQEAYLQELIFLRELQTDIEKAVLKELNQRAGGAQ